MPQGSFSCRVAAIHLLAADNTSRTASVKQHPLDPSTGRYHPLDVWNSANLNLANGFAPQQSLLLEEKVARHKPGRMRCNRVNFTPHQSPAVTASPQGEALGAPAPVKQLEFDEEKENLMRCQDGLVILLRIENS